MSDENAKIPFPTPLELADAMATSTEQIQSLLNQAMNSEGGADVAAADPLNVVPAFREFNEALFQNPQRLIEAQMKAWQTYAQIWENTARAWLGENPQPVVGAEDGDRRFNAEAWNSNPFFVYVRQMYLATAQALQAVVAGTDGLDNKTAHKVRFYTQQYIDAIAPTNFALTNPQVLEETLRTGGRNLVEGLKNLLADIDPASGRVNTRMVDKSAFEIGENVAVSEGKVVYQTDLMQLIQYSPATETVFQRPLLIVPPWINKFYILDLQPKNSFIRAAVEHGYTVFVVSWVNPDAALANKDFDNYMLEGPLAALDAIERATGESKVNAIGYCLGGTLLGATLAYMKANGDDRIEAATFFTSMLDFTEPGDLGVFIDETQLDSIDELMAERGFLDGKEMATTFNMLRANDLIWSFVVNNYLLGRQPMAFDLLFWNADSTRMPARMHSTYLRRMYLENRLCKPGGMMVADTPIDLTEVDLPICFVSAKEDHIAPWRSTFAGARLFSGPVEFILSEAGHIAGIINPPGKREYGHWTGPPPREHDAETWLAAATHDEHSWWPRWMKWLEAYAGEQVTAREPGAGELPALEDAPGSYVRR